MPATVSWPQTSGTRFIVSLLGIKHVVVAINKMDLVDYSQETFERIGPITRDLSPRLDIPDVQFIPMSALKGDNVVVKARSHAVVPRARR